MRYAKNIVPDRQLRLRKLFVYSGLIFFWLLIFLLLVATGMPMPIVLLFEIGFLFFQYWYSDRIALYGIGATVVTSLEAPELHAMVDKLCLLADMPKPRVAIADIDMVNAFAAGRNSQHSVIIVTRGLQNRITDDELLAVLSHEVAHVANRDVAVMTIANTVVILSGLLTQASIWNRASGRRTQNGRSSQGVDIMTAVMLYVVSILIVRAISRYRELLADKSGALLLGETKDLASALIKMDHAISSTSKKDLRQAESFNAFFFTPSFRGKKGHSLAELFSTHPSLERRLEQLNNLQLAIDSTSASGL